MFINPILKKKLEHSTIRLMLIRQTVKQFERDARDEYRNSHAPKFLCEQCDCCFVSKKELSHHWENQETKAVHKRRMEEMLDDEVHFDRIRNIFNSDLGRRLMANRLLFSKELCPLDSRVAAAINDPYRPNLSDWKGNREEGTGTGGGRFVQSLRGMMVQGIDATSGMRSTYRRSGLGRQHLAPVYQKSSESKRQIPIFQDVLNDLRRCKDEFVDTVYSKPVQNSSAGPKYSFLPTTGSISPLYAEVHFQWEGFSKGKSFITGEFTGWKPEELVSDWNSGTLSIKKILCAGKYRYRFLIDGVERIDEKASTCIDPRTGTVCNEIVVCRTPLAAEARSSLPVVVRDCPTDRSDNSEQFVRNADAINNNNKNNDNSNANNNNNEINKLTDG